MIKEVSKEQYLQLIGLTELSKTGMRQLKMIQSAMEQVLEVVPEDYETSGLGSPEHIADGIYSEYSTDELLGKLGLKPPVLFN